MQYNRIVCCMSFVHARIHRIFLFGFGKPQSPFVFPCPAINEIKAVR